jgi:homoserine kinase
VAGNSVRRLGLAPTLIPVIGVPFATLATMEAREALPSTVPHAAAARSVARSAFLIEGLRTGDAAALAAAAGDELHEAPRSGLSPVTAEMLAEAQEAGALHSSWSGAGPAVIALATDDTVEAVVAALQAVLGDEGEVMRPAVARTGVA